MLFFIIIVVVFEIVIYDSRANIALDVDACGIGFGQTASVSTANHVMIVVGYGGVNDLGGRPLDGRRRRIIV